MPDRTLRRLFLQSPAPPPPVAGLAKALRYAKGAILSPLYWLLAHRHGTPGLGFHAECARLGLALLFTPRLPIERGWAYQYLFLPLDSTRYLELDFMWKALKDSAAGRYLDVSSPRLFPVLLLRHRPALVADLVNPDTKDLAVTERLVQASGVGGRARLHDTLIADAPFDPESFDLITSISVVEHIPADTEAIASMWRLLKPGGRLLLSMPAMAEAAEQVINYNEYGLLPADDEGNVFWQRYYDRQLLAERILTVTGPPARQVVFGEKVMGSFQANAAAKRLTYFTTYPFWREPLMMGLDYRVFPSIDDLPGEGVVAMEFVKPLSPA